MRQIKKQVTIDAPIETVYQIVANVQSYPDFLPGVESVAVTGDLVTMRGRLGPFSLTMKTRVRFVPNSFIYLKLVEGPFRVMDGKWAFEPVPGGTRVTYAADYELGLAFRLPGMKSAVENVFRAEVEKTLAAFRHRILSVHRQALAS